MKISDNGNNRPPALCAGEVPDEKLKMNELGLLGFYLLPSLLLF